MVADGFGGNVEVVGDVGVAFALRDEASEFLVRGRLVRGRG